MTLLKELFSTTFDPSEEGRRQLLGIALQVAEMSPDKFKQVGCIACFPSWEQSRKDAQYKSQLRALAVGANHSSSTSSALLIRPDETEEQFRIRRRPFMIHAEIDLMSRIPDREQRTLFLYTTLFPCCSCMTALAAFGFTEIHYIEIYERDKPALAVADHYGITCIEHDM